MKVLFSNPPWWEGRERAWRGLRTKWRQGVRAGSRWPFTYLGHSSPDHARRDYLPYPFFMGYAASYAKRHSGADVHFRDSIALKESYETYFEHLKKERYEYILIESASPSWEHDAALIQKIHALLPHCKIAVAGPIATTRAKEILEKLPVTACLSGEYDKTATAAIKGKTGAVGFDMLTEAEMNQAPFPWFDELHAYRYWDSNPKGQKAPHAQVWSSRGCPFKCIFCVWPATMTGNDPDGTKARKVRHYTPEYMEAFLGELTGRFKYRTIYFDDDTFNLGNSHVLKMCEVMKRIGLPWSAMCRADSIKLETWKVMKESGCFGVKIGFESGNQEVVDRIVNKHLDLEEASRVVHELKRLGMTVHGTFTYGLPGETKEQMLDTRRFIKSLPFDTVQQSGTAEIEGTPLHTLRTKGPLSAYGGAAIDSGYDRQKDGNKKWQSIVKQLQES